MDPKKCLCTDSRLLQCAFKPAHFGGCTAADGRWFTHPPKKYNENISRCSFCANPEDECLCGPDVW